jgi:hypothetical protein
VSYRVAGIAGLAACGRVGFGAIGTDAVSDVARDAPSDAAPRFVQLGTVSGTATAPTVAMPSPTTAGNMLIMFGVQRSFAASVLTGMSDDAPGGTDTFQPVAVGNAAFTSGCTGSSADVWYAANIHGGARHVTLTLSQSVIGAVWVLELAGVSTSPTISGATISGNNAAGMVSGDVEQVDALAVVVSGLATCGDVNAFVPDGLFVAAPLLINDGLAYAIAPSAGAYGAAWDYGGGEWIGTTAAFR